MKKFLIQVFLYLLIIVLLDMATGFVMSYMVDHAQGGDTNRHNYICSQSKDDILIFGSSRALRHYNSILIGDSLGMSCHNCGESGNGIIYNYGQYQMIKQRYTPKILIYEFYPPYDYLKGDNQKYLRWLKPYYDRQGISEIFNSVDNREKYKMTSNLYKYNSLIFNIIPDFIHPMKSSGIKGFVPLASKGRSVQVNKNVMKLEYMGEEDKLKLYYLKKLIMESKGSKLIFVMSPTWYGVDERGLVSIKRICQEENIPFIDFSNDTLFVHNNTYFKDGNHLNEDGANMFSKQLVEKIKPIVFCN